MVKVLMVALMVAMVWMMVHELFQFFILESFHGQKTIPGQCTFEIMVCRMWLPLANSIFPRYLAMGGEAALALSSCCKVGSLEVQSSQSQEGFFKQSEKYGQPTDSTLAVRGHASAPRFRDMQES
jgi:hypothetical protein